jgi:hypothetical protein
LKKVKRTSVCMPSKEEEEWTNKQDDSLERRGKNRGFKKAPVSLFFCLSFPHIGAKVFCVTIIFYCLLLCYRAFD